MRRAFVLPPGHCRLSTDIFWDDSLFNGELPVPSKITGLGLVAPEGVAGDLIASHELRSVEVAVELHAAFRLWVKFWTGAVTCPQNFSKCHDNERDASVLGPSDHSPTNTGSLVG